MNNVQEKEVAVIDMGQVIDNAMSQHQQGFPIEVFPAAIQKLIKMADKTVGYPIDYFSAGILSTCATAIGNSTTLYNGSYSIKPILWLLIVGRTGTNKTHPLQFAKKPIEKRDRQSFKEYEILVGEYEQQEKDQRGNKPKYSKFILKDFTPEKLAEALQFNEKGVLIHQDEVMRWINSFDQYKKGGDQQMYLDLFNGNELTVDRITKDPIRVEETNVNILGGMQPEVLKGIANNNRNKDGFLQRFLFVYPDIHKPFLFTGEDITPAYKQDYHKLINNLLDAPELTIQVEPNIMERYKEWQHQKAKVSWNDHLENGIQAKLEIYVWRLALVLELMHQAAAGSYNSTLKLKSLNDAITLVEYFRYNALKAHDRILFKTPLNDLTALQLDVYDNMPDKFKRAEILPLFESKGMEERSGDRFLKNSDLFYNRDTLKDLKYGEYQKKYPK